METGDPEAPGGTPAPPPQEGESPPPGAPPPPPPSALPGWNPQPPGSPWPQPPGGAWPQPPAWNPTPPGAAPPPPPPGGAWPPGGSWPPPPPGWNPTPPGAIPGWNPAPPGYPPYAAAGAYWYGGPHAGTGGFRPRGVGELLDGAFTLYRRNFVLLVAIAAVVQVPFAFLSLIAFGLADVSGRLSSLQTLTRSVQNQGNILTPDQSSLLYQDIGAIVAYFAGIFIVQYLVVFPLSQAATTSAVSARYLDQETSVRASYGAALARWRSLIAMVMWLVLLVGGPVVLAVVFAVATGSTALLALFLVAFLVFYLIVLVRATVAPAAIVLEKLSGWQGIRRSFLLTSGSWWRIFGIRLLLAIIQGIAGYAIILPVTALSSATSIGTQQAIGQVAQAIVAVFIAPITLVTLTLLYYDLRIRREGFDIEMLAASL